MDDLHHAAPYMVLQNLPGIGPSRSLQILQQFLTPQDFFACMSARLSSSP